MSENERFKFKVKFKIKSIISNLFKSFAHVKEYSSNFKHRVKSYQNFLFYGK